MFVRLLVLTVTAVLFWTLVVHESAATGPERTYRVKAGDTLWAIAVAEFAGDPREGVWELRQRNRLDEATIVPGQRLILP